MASSAAFCKSLLALVTVLVAAVRAQENASLYIGLDLGPYLQIYPPAQIMRNPGNCTPSEDVVCPLYITLMLAIDTKGTFNSGGAIPGVQIALDQINGDPSTLPGYKLHYLLTDSGCDRQIALKSFHTHLIEPPTKVGVLGSGCSIATEAIAEIGPFHNLTQVSCVSSSAGLTNRARFPRYFQVSASELNLIFGFYGIIREYGWSRIAIITEDDDLFTVTVDNLKDLLRESGVTDDIRETRFESRDGLNDTDHPLDNNSRIFVLAMFPKHAREILCLAHLQGRGYPRSLFLVLGWYPVDWWKEDQDILAKRYPGCTVETREKVLEYTLAPRKAGRTFKANESKVVADSGINGEEIEKLYQTYLEASALDISQLNFYQQCYDATWTMARALNNTISDINSDPSISAAMAYYNRDVNGEEFGAQHFTYNNSKFADVMFDHLNNTNFRGIVGRIAFDSKGNRIVPTVDVQQYMMVTDENGTETLKPIKIGDIIRGELDTDTQLQYINNNSARTLFPFGVPLDGVPCEVVVGVNPGLSGFFIALAVTGMVLSVVGITVHLFLRNKAVIRLSSPNLNFLIGTGAIILYIDIIITVLPTTGQTVQSVLCNLTPWLTAIGYSLCYGTILAKMARVYYIFDNPSQRKKKPLQDWMLILGVGVLVAIDVAILFLYDIIEGLRGNLEAQWFPNRENPQDLQGDLEKITNYFVYVCHNRSRSITIGVLYGYKMLLQIIALIFAFSIRKVKIKGLNDAKYIAVAVYITSIVTAIVIVITYTLNMRINIFAGIFCAGFFIGTTAILGLVMIPPLLNHLRDPKGEKIFSGADAPSLSGSSINRKSLNRIGLPEDPKDVEGLKKKIVELEKRLTSLGEENLQKANEALDERQASRRSQVVTFSEGSSPGAANSNEINSNEQVSHE